MTTCVENLRSIVSDFKFNRGFVIPVQIGLKKRDFIITPDTYLYQDLKRDFEKALEQAEKSLEEL